MHNLAALLHEQGDLHKAGEFQPTITTGVAPLTLCRPIALLHLTTPLNSLPFRTAAKGVRLNMRKWRSPHSGDGSGGQPYQSCVSAAGH